MSQGRIPLQMDLLLFRPMQIFNLPVLEQQCASPFACKNHIPLALVAYLGHSDSWEEK
jgi:hypothetical protein